MVRASLLSVWLLSVFGVPSAGVAQEIPDFAAKPAELVVLSVVVKDRQGHDVTDLDRNRFVIYDDGRPQTISVFGNADTPVSAGVIIDRSGSMRPKLGEVVIAALEFARTSNPDDELFAIAFNEHVTQSGAVAHLGRNGVEALNEQLHALTAHGETALYDGLVAGLDRLSHASHPRKILILVSDGADNASQISLADVLARARRENVSIYTIGLFDRDSHDRNPKVLQALAETTGGQRFLPNSPGTLLAVCNRIAREIRGSYTLAFEPPTRDGSYHHLRVEITGGPEKLTVRTRPGYAASLKSTTE
jgi:Ca-activated chloride channel family protein